MSLTLFSPCIYTNDLFFYKCHAHCYVNVCFSMGIWIRTSAKSLCASSARAAAASSSPPISSLAASTSSRCPSSSTMTCPTTVKTTFTGKCFDRPSSVCSCLQRFDTFSLFQHWSRWPIRSQRCGHQLPGVG